jgi:hypothetical protein
MPKIAQSSQDFNNPNADVDGWRRPLEQARKQQSGKDSYHHIIYEHSV